MRSISAAMRPPVLQEHCIYRLTLAEKRMSSPLRFISAEMHPLRFISAEMHPYKRHYDRVGLYKHFVQTFLRGATGHWSLVTGHWPLATGHWPLTTGHWPLATGHWPLYFHLTEENKHKSFSKLPPPSNLCKVVPNQQKLCLADRLWDLQIFSRKSPRPLFLTFLILLLILLRSSFLSKI